jgi:hypothetical protein
VYEPLNDRIYTLIDDGQDTMSQNNDGFLVSQLAKLCKTATLQIFLAARSLAYISDNKTNKSLTVSS